MAAKQEPVIDDLGREIGLCYIGLIRRIKGNKNYGLMPNGAFPKKLASCLPRASEIVRELGASPEEYVLAMSTYSDMEHFFPSELCRDFDTAVTRLNRYRKEVVIPGSKYHDMLHVLNCYLCRQMDGGATRDAALNNRHVDFFPWFRILAADNVTEEMKSLYLRPAAQELTLDLRQFLKTYVTPDGRKFDLTRIPVKIDHYA